MISNKDNKRTAIVLMLASALSFATMSLFVKLASDVPFTEKVFFRNLVSLLIAALVVANSRSSFFGQWRNQPYLLLRSLFGLGGVACFFYAIDHLILVDAEMLNKLSPFFVALFAALFLGERLNWIKSFALILAFGGALLVIKPAFDLRIFPAAIGLLSAACAGAAYTMLRFMKGKESAQTIVFYFSFVSVLGIFPFLIGHFRWPEPLQICCLVAIGVFAAAGQFLLTLAYRYAPASQVSVLMYTGILFSGLYGLLFFSEFPDVYSLLGGAMIVLAGVTIYLQRQSSDS